MFRYSIRELFLLVLVVALAIGWCIEHYRAIAARGKYKILRESYSTVLYHLEQETGRHWTSQLPDGEVIESNEPELLIGGCE
jgi:hypothetical protein